ncbi:hypothetical protein PR048_014274 [Dryococelus australis]|uniref:Uncharacterized protein n=1 Tax=Dryococelus australis TaxID=614101 RepID=A0ABQ9HDR0_9NEOP|nr:hypothetical protein PR048_014274 [Dryococelus australis]
MLGTIMDIDAGLRSEEWLSTVLGTYTELRPKGVVGHTACGHILHPTPTLCPWLFPLCYTRPRCGGKGEIREVVAGGRSLLAEVLVFPEVHNFDLQNGGVVAKRLYGSPPTNATGFNPRWGLSRIVTLWESCRMMPLASWFSLGSPVSPILAFQCCSTTHIKHTTILQVLVVAEVARAQFAEPKRYRYEFRSSRTSGTHTGHGGVAFRLLTSHVGEPSLIPGGVAPRFSHVGIIVDNAAGRLLGTSLQQVHCYQPDRQVSQQAMANLDQQIGQQAHFPFPAVSKVVRLQMACWLYHTWSLHILRNRCVTKIYETKLERAHSPSEQAEEATKEDTMEGRKGRNPARQKSLRGGDSITGIRQNLWLSGSWESSSWSGNEDTHVHPWFGPPKLQKSRLRFVPQHDLIGVNPAFTAIVRRIVLVSDLALHLCFLNLCFAVPCSRHLQSALPMPGNRSGPHVTDPTQVSTPGLCGTDMSEIEDQQAGSTTDWQGIDSADTVRALPRSAFISGAAC